MSQDQGVPSFDPRNMMILSGTWLRSWVYYRMLLPILLTSSDLFCLHSKTLFIFELTSLIPSLCSRRRYGPVVTSFIPRFFSTNWVWQILAKDFSHSQFQTRKTYKILRWGLARQMSVRTSPKGFGTQELKPASGNVTKKGNNMVFIHLRNFDYLSRFGPDVLNIPKTWEKNTFLYSMHCFIIIQWIINISLGFMQDLGPMSLTKLSFEVKIRVT